MENESPHLLTLAPDGSGWLADGRAWLPSRPLWGVVGDPVAHSLSPSFQTHAFAALGIDADYLRLEVSARQWSSFVSGASALGLHGCNVTAPHKEAAFASCVDVSESARETGAVNTLRFTAEGPYGHNTDVGGLEDILALEGVDRRWRGFVMGAGGSARSAVVAMKRRGVRAITVVARPGASRRAFADWLHARSFADVEVVLLDWERPAPTPPGPALGVATLPAGVGYSELLPLASGSHERLLLDLRYGGSLPDQDHEGWRLRDGAGLLLAQGLLSLEWWFEQRPPMAPLAAALQAALAEQER